MAQDVSLAHATSAAPQVIVQQQPQQIYSFSFAQGFMLGQVSVVILIFFFIKFFIFGETPSSSDYHLRHHGRSSRAVSFSSSSSRYLTASSKARVASPLSPTNPLTTSAILEKTYYNVRNHQPESVDWFNVLVAQTLAQLRDEAQRDNAILTSLTDLLNGERRPDYLDEIKVTELSLGEEFPIFSNCRIIPVDDGHAAASLGSPPSSRGGVGNANAPAEGSTRLQARMDVDLSDAITLGIETKILLNYPRPLVAVMPVALAVSVVRFSGTLSISFIPSPTPPTPDHTSSESSRPQSPSPSPPTKSPPTALIFSFDPSYRLELSTHSLLGSRSRLQDIPKIAQLVEARLHAWFDERCVEPRFQRVVLPSLWPRRGNVGTRGERSDPDGDHESEHDAERPRTRATDTAPGRTGDGGGSSSDYGAAEDAHEGLAARHKQEMQREAALLRAKRERQTAEGLRWRSAYGTAPPTSAAAVEAATGVGVEPALSSSAVSLASNSAAGSGGGGDAQGLPGMPGSMPP